MGGTMISSYSSTGNSLLNYLTAQTTALTAYSGQLTSQYNAQFTALDSYMATTNSDEQYLTALFGGSGWSRDFRFILLAACGGLRASAWPHSPGRSDRRIVFG